MKQPAPTLYERGFTVLETLIVVGIAGMILLIVFLAVPALERNSSNNRRNQDVQIILQAVSRYELNHSGTVPDTAQLTTFLNAYEAGKLTYYDTTNITVNLPAATNISQTYPSIPLNLSKVQVNNHAKCQADGMATNQGAGYSDVVALYAIETATNQSPHCQQL